MLELPNSISIEDHQRLSDWVELSALLEAPYVSESDVSHFIDTYSPLLSTIPEDPDPLSDDDQYEVLGDLKRELKGRSRAMSTGYPFSVDHPEAFLCLHDDGLTWQEIPAYTALLLWGFVEQVPEFKEQLLSPFDDLFERIVCASKERLFSGLSVVFPASSDAGWSRVCRERVEHLGEILGLRVNDLTDLIDPTDKDIGLDVVTRWRIGALQAGTLYILTQCTVGPWKKKRGQPPLSRWKDFYLWDSQQVIGLAIPSRVSDDRDMDRISRHGGWIVFDRDRIASGVPDAQLDSDSSRELCSWCDDAIRTLEIA